jgi:hypothetical protein
MICVKRSKCSKQRMYLRRALLDHCNFAFTLLYHYISMLSRAMLRRARVVRARSIPRSMPSRAFASLSLLHSLTFFLCPSFYAGCSMAVLTVALVDNVTHGMIICVSLLQPSECGRVTYVHRPLDQGFSLFVSYVICNLSVESHQLAFTSRLMLRLANSSWHFQPKTLGQT